MVVDFTPAGATVAHAAALADAGTAWVIGTTGLDAAAERAIDAAAARVAVVQAPNFSPGVNLLLALAARLAAALDPAEYDAEILEMHHRGKRDAPSGTALAIGRAVAAGRGQRFEGRGPPVPRRRDGRAAAGGDRLRGPARAARWWASTRCCSRRGAEQIVLGDRVFDRRVFADGAIRAALWTAGRPPGRSGMAQVLGLG